MEICFIIAIDSQCTYEQKGSEIWGVSIGKNFSEKKLQKDFVKLSERQIFLGGFMGNSIDEIEQKMDNFSWNIMLKKV